MHAIRVDRVGARASDLAGRVLCHAIHTEDGRIAIAKGRVLDESDATRALHLPWAELHLLALDDGDMHEDVAGDRIARAASGAGVTVRAPAGGHWPIASQSRGLLGVDTERLEQINALDGPCVYSLFDGQVVEANEVVARAKIIPFAVAASVVGQVESICSNGSGVIHVSEFRPHRVGAVVHESMGERAVARFRGAVTEKLAWFGSALCTLEVVPQTVDGIGQAFAAVSRAGAEIVLVAGTKAMDVLDPTFATLDQIGARIVAHGVPAHPGSLLWLAEWNRLPVVGMPTCGLFAQATVFDVVIARLLTDQDVGRRELARFGHGGFLTRDMAFRLPAYRAASERGAVE